MNLEEMKRRKKELGITNQQLADFSGVPVGTVNKIFSGATKSPQHDTVVAWKQHWGCMFLIFTISRRMAGR